MARTYLSFPIKETGVYLNRPLHKLQFWVFNKNTGFTKLIGECHMNMPESVKLEWEKHTANELKTAIAGTIANQLIISQREKREKMDSKGGN